MNFEQLPLERAVTDRARAAGVALDPGSVAAIAFHARAVIAANARLHLTAIEEPVEFVERHIGESLDGAAQLAPDVAGTLVDLGSGNGYPGVPLAAARPGLQPRLVEASMKKAAFLREVARGLGWPDSAVMGRAIHGARDLEELAPIGVLATRAMGGWERLIPKLSPLMAEDGVVLLWAGAEVELVLRRVAWRRYTLQSKVALPGRERSWIWRFSVGGANNSMSESKPK